jgi:hypothetical protein
LAEDPGLPLLTTTQLLRQAAAGMALNDEEIGRLLWRVRHGARFEPPPEDPERAWWLSVIADA